MTIPIMFYISTLFLPVSLFGYLTFAKPKKKILARAANPADTLKEQRVDTERELTAAIFLGATIAFSAGLLISISWLIGDYKSSRNLFAESLPAASFPPAMQNVFPPAPADEPITKAETVTETEQ